MALEFSKPTPIALLLILAEDSLPKSLSANEMTLIKIKLKIRYSYIYI